MPYLAQAPYNHVPINDCVFFPDQSVVNAISHDHPFEDGVSGSLKLRIIQVSPLLVNGIAGAAPGHKSQGDSDIYARQLDSLDSAGSPVKQWGFEGSSLRGEIRQVLNIATFGKVGPTGERRYHLRDLNSSSYKNWMVKDLSESEVRKIYKSKVKAGRLRFDSARGRWTLTPCEYSRVQHFAKTYSDARKNGEASIDGRWSVEERSSCLMNLVESPRAFDNHFYIDTQFRDGAQVRVFHPKRNGTSPFAAADFYDWFRADKNAPKVTPDFSVTFRAGECQLHAHTGKQLCYSEATDLVWAPKGGEPLPAGMTKGHLVLTGNIGVGGISHKHMEFVFHLPTEDTQPIDLPDEVTQAFDDINGQSVDYKYWRSKYVKGQCDFIPVFWVSDPNGNPDVPAAIGLCQMFKLPSAKTTRGFLPDCHNSPDPDWSQLIFGVENGSKGQEGWERRVQFSSVLCSTPERVATDVHCRYRVALGQPSAFAPFAVKQDGKVVSDKVALRATLKSGEDFLTLVDEKSQWSGRRRYPARTFTEPPLAGNIAEVVKTLHPVEPKSLAQPVEYSCNVNVHNLRSFEFGALLWALTFGHNCTRGGNPYVHQVGLAKAYAFGQIQIQIDWEESSVRKNSNWDKCLTEDEASAYVVEFVQGMNEFLNRSCSSAAQLAETDPVKTLLCMAQPRFGDELEGLKITEFKHLPLTSFRAVKTKPKHVLPTYLELVQSIPGGSDPAGQEY